MFPRSGLFGTCPDWSSCTAYNCLFSHKPPPTPSVRANPPPQRQPAPSSSSLPQKRPASGSPADGNAAKRMTPGMQRIEALAGLSPMEGAPPSASTSKAPSAAAKTASSAPRAAPSASAALDLPPNAGPPRLPMPKVAAHTPTVTRQKMLTTLYNQFLDIYSPGILPTSLRHTLASQHALTQEETLFSRSTKATYRNAVIGALARLKKRSQARSVDETGTLEDEAERLAKVAEEVKGRLTRERVGRWVHDRETLGRFGYPVEVPEGEGGDRVTEEGNVRECDRCKKEYVVKGALGEDELHACSYHFGRMVTEKIAGTRQRVYSCCPSAGAPPCQTGPHTFKDDSLPALHSRVPFLSSSTLRSSLPDSASLPPAVDVAALDCELVYTTSGMSLARVTVLSASGSVLLDEHVRPPSGSSVVDLNTRFSGVQKEDLDKAVLDVAGVRKALAQFMDEETVFVGHGVENDLRALRLVHFKVIDTAILFPHPNGGTWRYSLRNLTKDILGKFIQQDDPTVGHSAKDDAEAALELVRWKVKKGG
ncbi:hypothetical protein JCM6882_006172 [Rhodosporidiobolus microsporus]